MPHVVIEDAGDLGIACQGIKLATVRNGSEILKVVDVYLNRSSRTALIDCVVVEAGRAQSFDPLSKVWLDPGGPIGATWCHTVQHRIPKNPYVLARRRGFDSPRLHFFVLFH